MRAILTELRHDGIALPVDPASCTLSVEDTRSELLREETARVFKAAKIGLPFVRWGLTKIEARSNAWFQAGSGKARISRKAAFSPIAGQMSAVSVVGCAVGWKLGRNRLQQPSRPPSAS